MRVIVFGANGRTGRLLTDTLIARGYQPVAITRHPEQIENQDGRVVVERADATDPVAVTKAIEGADAIVSVLGARFTRQPVTLYSQSAALITQAMSDANVRRLIITSSAVVGGWIDPQYNWVEKHVMPRILLTIGRTVYEDIRRLEAVVTASALDWTIMRPLGLIDADPPTKYSIAEDHIPGRVTARQDLASAIADQLGQEDYYRKFVAVATTNKNMSVGQTIWREGIKPNLKKLQLIPARSRLSPHSAPSFIPPPT